MAATLDRLIRRTAKAANGCVEWQGGKDRDGYGKTWYQGKDIRAHRLMHLLVCGPIPDGAFVCHSCDNPACVHPAHLWLGTDRDNVLDMHRKDRHVKNVGVRHGMAKVNEQIVRNIRGLARRGVTHQRIADRLSIARTTVTLIVNYRLWKHVS